MIAWTEFSADFQSGNAAFGENPAEEMARILRDIAERIEQGQENGKARDINGNSIGSWWFITESENEGS